MTPDGRQALKEKVFHWLKERIIRKVWHPKWVANALPIRLASGVWKVQVDYSSLNKVCAKDMYPFPEEGKGLASLMDSDTPKDDERVLADQRGRNVEVYLEEIVIKSKNEYNLIQDVEETLSKLRRVNIKIDPNASTFGIDEGKFLGYMVTKEGVRADPEKVQAIILSPIPKNEPEGPLVKKFLGQGKHGLGTSGASREETISVGKELEPNLTPTPKAWRLYLGKEALEEGSCIGMILVSPDEMIRSYAIRLNFKASEHSRDCEALLAGLVASAGQDIKYLHVFIDSPTLAAPMEGSYAPAMRQERKQGRDYGCNSSILQVLNHTPSKNFKPQSRSVNRVGNHKVGITQSGSIGRYHNKTIGGGDKQQQEGKRGKQCTRSKAKLQLGNKWK
ncbi:hypothetical protein Tco_1172313 [Tanacetum coccineum]